MGGTLAKYSSEGKNIISLIENNIFGVDITDYSIHRTKIILSLYAIENNQDKEKIKGPWKIYSQSNPISQAG